MRYLLNEVCTASISFRLTLEFYVVYLLFFSAFAFFYDEVRNQQRLGCIPLIYRRGTPFEIENN